MANHEVVSHLGRAGHHVLGGSAHSLHAVGVERRALCTGLCVDLGVTGQRIASQGNLVVAVRLVHLVELGPVCGGEAECGLPDGVGDAVDCVTLGTCDGVSHCEIKGQWKFPCKLLQTLMSSG